MTLREKHALARFKAYLLIADNDVDKALAAACGICSEGHAVHP